MTNSLEALVTAFRVPFSQLIDAMQMHGYDPRVTWTIRTLSVSDVTHFSVSNSSGSLVACSNLTLDSTNSNENVIALNATVASGLTAGDATYLISNNASALLELNARL